MTIALATHPAELDERIGLMSTVESQFASVAGMALCWLLM